MTEEEIQTLIVIYQKANDLWCSQCYAYTFAPESLRRDAHETAREGFRELRDLLSPFVMPTLKAEYREAEQAAAAEARAPEEG